ncbi:hypothetical protein GXP70_24375 [Paenibacillus lycopersici]|uniref:Uncharacterized protein n=1 Tax=Paenibacillus lycopersici TaxID=2704462 RepID=A0A6C0G0B0_9BACL|nr:hypothetical protein [Paenibacillus lycopersici]QHT62806.1 hypothetical protein GXP70_24375 [Paenibacillus lycopersici]
MTTWYALPSLLTISLLVTAFQWHWMRQARRKEKLVYLTLLAAGWILAVLLLIDPRLPGPTQLVNALFENLGRQVIHGGKAGS